jgi:hypothetical protein
MTSLPSIALAELEMPALVVIPVLAVPGEWITSWATYAVGTPATFPFETTSLAVVLDLKDVPVGVITYRTFPEVRTS